MASRAALPQLRCGAAAWRRASRWLNGSVFAEIVNAFADHDYELNRGVSGVDAISTKTAAQVENYIREYRATLVALPEEAWNSSVCIWAGSHWDVLVDLWTPEEEPSDLVLGARVVEAKSGFSFQVQMVYVP